MLKVSILHVYISEQSFYSITYLKYTLGLNTNTLPVTKRTERTEGTTILN